MICAQLCRNAAPQSAAMAAILLVDLATHSSTDDVISVDDDDKMETDDVTVELRVLGSLERLLRRLLEERHLPAFKVGAAFWVISLFSTN